jgi:hypothetical protein
MLFAGAAGIPAATAIATGIATGIGAGTGPDGIGTDTIGADGIGADGIAAVIAADCQARVLARPAPPGPELVTMPPTHTPD